jgi:pyruvate,water dikinase
MADREARPNAPLVLDFHEIDHSHAGQVGGKNASLGEMIGALSERGIRVPEGFATTASAYWHFIRTNELRPRLEEELGGLKQDGSNLATVGERVRKLIRNGEVPGDLSSAVVEAYDRLSRAAGRQTLDVAVRSSATAEDLPEASFAGQLETYLNVRGEEALLKAVKDCFASLFTDRAIAYREEHNFDHMSVALSAGVQRMVRSDKAGSGVMFSIDTETGFPRSVLVNAVWGLGETIVQGQSDPDEYHVFKPLLDREVLTPIVEKRRGRKEIRMVYPKKAGGELETKKTSKAERQAFVLSDQEVLTLARWAARIEQHYGQPMDIEWAKDGEDEDLFIVQARPETVQSQKSAGSLKSYRLGAHGKALVEGTAIGDAVAAGTARKLKSPEEVGRFAQGDVLVADMTDPDWVPVMKKASAIVTDHGGRTSHAAIVSRELQLPAVVGAEIAMETLEDGQDVTVSCAQGDRGVVYEGKAEIEVEEIDTDAIPKTDTQVMINLANPAAAYRWWRLPFDGVGLARMEFIIGNAIKVHPMALLHPDRVSDKQVRKEVLALAEGYDPPADYFVDTLARGMARLASSAYPRPVIVRLSDFKTNEYADLLGGADFEPPEENPMLGWRGASRYYDEDYREGFALECQAVRKAREEIGLDNIVVMVPFCRTVEEADRVLEVMAGQGLIRGVDGLAVYVMAELPSNVFQARRFAERFDGFSIGSNDLTQLVLGVDRDSDRLSRLFDERDPAVLDAVAQLLAAANEVGVKTGICGQAPSDHPELARFLVHHGIGSISVSPDSFLDVKRQVAEIEAEIAQTRN